MEFRSLPTTTTSGILPQRQVAAIRNYKHVILNASTRGKEIQVILDSSIQRNFILLEIIKQLNMPIQEKKEPYLLNIINRTAIKQDKGIVRHETIPIQVTIKKHIEEISLDIIKINNY
jgi:hypothetical protein